MDTRLAVTLTRAYDRSPVAVIHNLPRSDSALHPEQLRALATALLATADAAEAAAKDGQRPLALTAGINVEFPLSSDLIPAQAARA